MNNTSQTMYEVLGLDGKQYGPKTAEIIRDWIESGRLNDQSLIRCMGDTEWIALGKLPEFEGVASVPPVNEQSKPLSPAYPVSIKVFGILNVIFGAIGFCGSGAGAISLIFLGWASQHPELGNEVRQQMSESHLLFVQIMIFPAFVLTVLLFISGIGLLRNKKWGHKSSITYGILAIFQAIINAIGTTFLTNNAQQIITAYAGGMFNLAFATCILYFLTRPNVIEVLKN
ncbi:MAG: DUF4339 domain-containing protein [Verrucomicrobiota bacterium]|nr:DUF4339 domain-containing protein [Verrucomicrobiota bacterium]MDP7050075.1 DUF4339 domain-containing protein [Verrucomicrobiota bacterium]